MQTKNVARKIDFLYMSAWAECRRKKDNIEMLFFSRMQWNKTCTKALPDFLFSFFDVTTRSTFRKNAQTPNITDR